MESEEQEYLKTMFYSGVHAMINLNDEILAQVNTGQQFNGIIELLHLELLHRDCVEMDEYVTEKVEQQMGDILAVKNNLKKVN